MAFLEWRKLHFFDLSKYIDQNCLKIYIKDKIAFSTSGNGQLIFGDNKGYIHVVSKDWSVVSFIAYEESTFFGYLLKDSSLLVTIGENKSGTYPILKLWDISLCNRSNEPPCLRMTRLATQNFAVAATALAVCNHRRFIAVGFADGSLILFYGNIQRDKSSKQKIRRSYHFAITGLAFRFTSSSHDLFIATTNNIYVYDLLNLDKDDKTVLDNIGSESRCAVLSDGLNDNHFIVGRDDAIYYYTADRRGPCYAMEGKKILIHWFHSYLIVVSELLPKSPTVFVGESNEHQLTILDIRNKFIVFFETIPKVQTIVNECGLIYIISENNEVYSLTEKDIESKLSLLFKKNLYDVAIRTAKSEQYDIDRLIDIFRQYGDHLYSKGDYLGAVEQYIKSIGKLDSSYVIIKFLNNQNLEMLAKYLVALHKYGHANEDHTTLLLNCFHKIASKDQLIEFIKNEDDNFNIDTAIEVCHQINYIDEAIYLAKTHKRHDWFLRIQIEDLKNFETALDYIKQLDEDLGQYYLKTLGNELFENNKQAYMECLQNRISKINPNEFIEFFYNDSKYLVEFIEYLYNKGFILSKKINNIFYEHCLRAWYQYDSNDNPDKLKYESIAESFLKNSTIEFNKMQIMLLSKKFGFYKGILWVMEEDKRYEQILDFYFERDDAKNALNSCKRFGYQPSLWMKLIDACANNLYAANTILVEVLEIISREKIFSPIQVINLLSNDQEVINLGHMRNYLIDEFKRETYLAVAEDNQNDNMDDLLKNIDDLKNQPIIFPNSKCQICEQCLELPSIHFLCQHSFHQSCFLNKSENECPNCMKDNRNFADFDKNLHGKFHSQLEMSDDSISLMTKYFSCVQQKKPALKTQKSTNPFDNDIPDKSYLSDDSKKIKTPDSKTNKKVSTNPFDTNDDNFDNINGNI